VIPLELDAETLQRIRMLHLRMGAQVTELVAGEYRSAYRGTGIEFEEVRPYQPGDDVRSIDWNVTARTGHPFVKLFREERELTVFLVVDLSASMQFGSLRRMKREAAAELAAALSFAAVRNRDKVGMLGFSQGIDLHVPPRKGNGHVWQILRSVLGAQPGPGSALAEALERTAQVQRRRAAVFVISDFLADGWERPLRLLASRHDLCAIVLEDPREFTWVDAGRVRLKDAETGATAEVDTADAAVRRRFEADARASRERRDQLLSRSGVDRLIIRPGDSTVDALMRFFRWREARR